jgi:hypothetical protein
VFGKAGTGEHETDEGVQKRAVVTCGSIATGILITATGKVDPDATTPDATRVWSRTSS